MNQNKALMAVIPCSGFGTRVSSYIPKGEYKETARVDNDVPSVQRYVDECITYLEVDILAITIAESKETLRSQLMDQIHTLGFCNERTQLKFAYHQSGEKTTQHMDVFSKKLACGKVRRVIFCTTPDDLHKTQNPYDAVKVVRYATAEYVVSDIQKKWDVVVMFPDIYYTRLRTVMKSIRNHYDTRSGEYAMSSLPIESVPHLDPAKFGRHKRVPMFRLLSGAARNYKVVEVEYSTGNSSGSATCLETGILYLPYTTLFKEYPQGTWIYDMMLLQCAPVHALEIEGTDLVDLGDPRSYIEPRQGLEISWS